MITAEWCDEAAVEIARERPSKRANLWGWQAIRLARIAAAALRWAEADRKLDEAISIDPAPDSDTFDRLEALRDEASIALRRACEASR